MKNDYEIIAEATNGLNYISETDSPFEVKELEPTGASIEATLLAMCGKKPGEPVEKVTLEHFLRNMVKADASAPQEEQQNATRFQQLQELLKKKLKSIEVYRIGSVNIDAIIVGSLQNGPLVAVTTKLVET